jgi:hypothetical protein
LANETPDASDPGDTPEPEEPAAPAEPPAKESAPAPDGAPAPAPGGDAAAPPPGSKVPYSSQDHNGNAVPPPGTLPEDAGMVPLGKHPQGEILTGPDGDTYFRSHSGEYTNIGGPPPVPP